MSNKLIKEKTSGSVIVSWDFSGDKDTGVLLVGEKTPGENARIINAFCGEEAFKLYKKLTTLDDNEKEKYK